MIVEGPNELSQVSLVQLSRADKEMQLRFGIDQAASDERAREVRASLIQFADQTIRERLSQKLPTPEMVNKRLEQTFHYVLGDKEFREDLARLHVPVQLASTPAPASTTPNPKKVRAIQAFFENSK